MFKKIFRPSNSHGHDLAGLRRGLGLRRECSTSSSGQETETVSISDTHDPQSRHFLQEPYNDTHQVSVDGADTSDTWDPFESKKPLRKSKSFSLKGNSHANQATMTKSRSVHFAEDLASHQAKMKQIHEQEKQAKGSLGFNEDEESSENSGGLGEEDTAAEKDTSEDDMEVNQSENYFDSQRERSESEFESSDSHQSQHSSDMKSKPSEGINISELREKNSFEANKKHPACFREVHEKSKKSVKIRSKRESSTNAGKFLQSYFPEEKRINASTVEEGKRMVSKQNKGNSGSDKSIGVENIKCPNVNFSDSTDVDSGEEMHVRTSAILYPIYQRVLRMVQLDYKEEANCNTKQLQNDTREALIDLDHVLQENKTQILEMQGNLRNLKAHIANGEEKRRRQDVSGENPQNELIKELRMQLNMQMEKTDSITQIHQKYVIEHDVKLRTLEQQMAKQGQAHSEVEESWRKKTESTVREKEELIRQVRILQRKSSEVDSFQAAEKRLLMEANTRLEADAKAIGCEKDRLQATVQKLQAQVAGHVAEARELSRVHEQRLQKLQAERTAEKSEDQAFNLELKREFKEIKEAKQALSVQHGELERSLQHQQEKNAAMEVELGAARSLGENLRRQAERCEREARERTMDLAAVRLSNQAAVASLQQIIQQSYKILAPRFQPDSTRQFSQIYSELAKIKLIDDRNKGVVVVLLAFLQTGLADVVRQFERNEEALGAEIENRRRFQEEVLSTFRSIVKQVVGINRERRPRSPAKKKAFR